MSEIFTYRFPLDLFKGAPPRKRSSTTAASNSRPTQMLTKYSASQRAFARHVPHMEQVYQLLNVRNVRGRLSRPHGWNARMGQRRDEVSFGRRSAGAIATRLSSWQIVQPRTGLPTADGGFITVAVKEGRKSIWKRREAHVCLAACRSCRARSAKAPLCFSAGLRTGIWSAEVSHLPTSRSNGNRLDDGFRPAGRYRSRMTPAGIAQEARVFPFCALPTARDRHHQNVQFEGRMRPRILWADRLDQQQF